MLDFESDRSSEGEEQFNEDDDSDKPTLTRR